MGGRGGVWAADAPSAARTSRGVGGPPERAAQRLLLQRLLRRQLLSCSSTAGSAAPPKGGPSRPWLLIDPLHCPTNAPNHSQTVWPRTCSLYLGDVGSPPRSPGMAGL